MIEARELEGFEGLYTIDRKGNVFSIKSRRYLKHSMRGLYPGVTLSKNGMHKATSVHRLVALTFIENPQNKPCVNHLDGNKNNCHLENLEWCTYSENEIHSREVLGKKTIHSQETRDRISVKAKLTDRTKDIWHAINARKGKPSHNCKKVVLNGERVFDSLKIAAEQTGVSFASISQNIRGISKFTRVGVWQYLEEN